MGNDGRLPVPVHRVNVPGVFLIRIGENVPAHPLTRSHGKHRAVPFEEAIDRIEVMELLNAGVVSLVLTRIAVDTGDVPVPIPTQRLVEQAELRDKLSVHVLRRAIQARHAATGDDDRSDQSRIDVPLLVYMRSEERRVGKECRSRWSPY